MDLNQDKVAAWLLVLQKPVPRAVGLKPFAQTRAFWLMGACMGLILLAIGFSAADTLGSLVSLRFGNAVVGRVVGLSQAQTGKGGRIYRCLLEFKGLDGKDYQARRPVSYGFFGSSAPGQVVPLHYVSAAPGLAGLDQDAEWTARNSVLVTVFLGLLLLACAWFLRRVWLGYRLVKYGQALLGRALSRGGGGKPALGGQAVVEYKVNGAVFHFNAALANSVWKTEGDGLFVALLVEPEHPRRAMIESPFHIWRAI